MRHFYINESSIEEDVLKFINRYDVWPDDTDVEFNPNGLTVIEFSFWNPKYRDTLIKFRAACKTSDLKDVRGFKVIPIDRDDTYIWIEGGSCKSWDKNTSKGFEETWDYVNYIRDTMRKYNQLIEDLQTLLTTEYGYKLEYGGAAKLY